VGIHSRARELAERRYRAAEDAHAAGQSNDALELIDRALAADPEPLLRARILRLRGSIEAWGGTPLAAHELLRTEAESVAHADPRLAAAMLADAAFAAVMGGAIDDGRAVAERAAALVAELDPATRSAAAAVLGLCLLLGDEPDRGERLVRAAIDDIRVGVLELDPLVRVAVACLFWIEEYGLADDLLAQASVVARETRHPLLAGLLDTRAAVDFRTGRWARSEARSREALRLARERGLVPQQASCLTTLARVAAARGRERECRARAEEAMALAPANDLVFGWALSAVGLLELGLGNVDAAVSELERVAASSARLMRTETAIVQSMADLVEAYVYAGRKAEAEALLGEFEERAAESGRSWAAAAAGRCRGLLAGASEFERHFEAALGRHRQPLVPFERARTELCYGQRLRRARRRGDARIQLQSALGTFEQLGARPWSERTRRELQATRARESPHDPSTILTAHELQVATRVSRGATNREIAVELFVTERTVEYHLTNIYTKLGLRSRTQLAAQLIATRTALP
jgi:DNA-binding CsgD family transcriptional regulator